MDSEPRLGTEEGREADPNPYAAPQAVDAGDFGSDPSPDIPPFLASEAGPQLSTGIFGTGGELVKAGQPFAFNPWTSIWVAPRSTIRMICDCDPRRHVYLVFAIVGAGGGLGIGVGAFLEIGINWLVVFGAILTGALVGIGLGPALSILVHAVSRALGGASAEAENRAACAWGQLPLAGQGVASLLVAITLMAGGGTLSAAIALDAGIGLLLVLAILAQTTIGIWGAVVASKCVSEVNQFSVWMGFAVLVATEILIVLVFVVAAFAVIATLLLGEAFLS